MAPRLPNFHLLPSVGQAKPIIDFYVRGLVRRRSYHGVLTTSALGSAGAQSGLDVREARWAMTTGDLNLDATHRTASARSTAPHFKPNASTFGHTMPAAL